MSEKLLLDEHYADVIAVRLREAGHDVTAVVADPELRAQPDAEIFRRAVAQGRRIVTDNVKDFRPLQQLAYATDEPVASLLLVPPGRWPKGARRTTAVVRALASWLDTATDRPDEDWLA